MKDSHRAMGSTKLKVTAAAALLAAGVSFAGSANALIKIGMSTALEGPAKGLGQNVRLGVEAYFNRVNGAGGVNGEKLELVALDDGYEPDRAAPNMRKLIKDEGVVSVIGNVGTPTAIVTVPIANEEKNAAVWGGDRRGCTPSESARSVHYQLSCELCRRNRCND